MLQPAGRKAMTGHADGGHLFDDSFAVDFACCPTSAVGAGLPEHVPGAAVVGLAGQHEEQIGEPVDVADGLGVDRFARAQRCGASGKRRGRA